MRPSLTRRVMIIPSKTLAASNRFHQEHDFKTHAFGVNLDSAEMEASGVAGAPCSLKIEAADRAVEVEDLSRKE